ncbi:MAG: DUF4186 domain-containing protein [Planctomycetota bacterium]|jgi:hypothetical protein
MCDINEIFTALGQSKFRSRFRLTGKEAQYLRDKGLSTILQHARDFVTKRLTDADPVNDGRQTPMKNHPVFVAQHATGTCCRKCLKKWHDIPKGKPLTEEHIDYILKVLKRWLAEQDIQQPTYRREKLC